jgi:hypothetical protein
VTEPTPGPEYVVVAGSIPAGRSLLSLKPATGQLCRRHVATREGREDRVYYRPESSGPLDVLCAQAERLNREAR